MTTMLKYDPLRIHFLSSCVGLAIGMSLFVEPNRFWNPIDGIIPYKFVDHAPGPLNEDEENASRHFHPIVTWGMRGGGATVSAFCLFHLLFSKPTQQPFLMRCKMALIFIHNLFCAQAILLFDKTVIKKTFFLFFVWFNTLVLIGLWQVYQSNFPALHRLLSPQKSWKPTALVGFCYTIPLGLIMTMLPQEVGPQGRLPYFRAKGSDQIMGMDDFMVLSTRFEGMSMLVWPYVLWESRDKPIIELSILAALLYELLFVEDGLLDTSGYVNMPAVVATLVLHSAHIAFLACELRQKNNAAHDWIDRAYEPTNTTTTGPGTRTTTTTATTLNTDTTKTAGPSPPRDQEMNKKKNKGEHIPDLMTESAAAAAAAAKKRV